MTTSLVNSLRPIARDQLKIRDRILRATQTSAENGARGNSTVLQWEMGSAATFFISLVGDSSQFAIDGSNDLLTWFAVDMQGIGGAPSSPIAWGLFYQENNGSGGNANAVTNLVGNKQSRFMRVRGGSTSSSRNSSIQVILSQTPFVPMRPTKNLGPDNQWTYAAPSGGLTTTSAQVVAAAGNTYHRNLVTSIELSNGSATGTEVLLLDDTTVIWRGWVAGGGQSSAVFDAPLRGTAAKAINIQTSVAAQVYANVHGLTALA